MAMYKNISGINQETFGRYVEGVLSYKVGHIRAGALFEAQDMGGVLRLNNGQYVYDRPRDFAIQPAPPPDPDPIPPPATGDQQASAMVVLQGNKADVIITVSPDVELSIKVNGEPR